MKYKLILSAIVMLLSMFINLYYDDLTNRIFSMIAALISYGYIVYVFIAVKIVLGIPFKFKD